MLRDETLGQYRALDTDERSRRVDEARALHLTEGIPRSWVGRLLDHWRERYGSDHAAANLSLLDNATTIKAAQHAGVPPDASDDDLCTIAKENAREALRRIHDAEGHAQAMLADRDAEQRERLSVLGRALVVLDYMGALGLGQHFSAAAERGIAGALRRVCDDRWWRRVLRRVHARAVESTARAMGLVSARAGCYASDDAVKRRRHQRARNAAALESVNAINGDTGQVYTLAELAAKGTANKEIRRGELMTRIKGFELIAKECGHIAIMATVTCPSRMHAVRKRRDGYSVEPNPSFDGTTVPTAQDHLTTQWQRCRSAADRAGLLWYGFRIAEPNHDGTPHWHLLLFFPKVGAFAERLVSAVRQSRRADGGDWGLDGPRAADGAVSLAGGDEVDSTAVAVYLLRRYFLWQVDPTESGARKHRVSVELIDWQRGGATHYVAKYVAKNIDGYQVEKDLEGNDAITSSMRVDTWASQWGIRQFQQVGGAPVTVWRELRRVNELLGDASPLVAMALDAVNTTRVHSEPEPQAPLLDDAPKAEPQGPNAAHGWTTYLHLQGGTRVRRRDLRLRVLREETGEVGRYGEVMAPKPVGVVAISNERIAHAPLPVGVPTVTIGPYLVVPRGGTIRRLWHEVHTEVESERCSWVIVPRSKRVERHTHDGHVFESRPMHPAAAGVMRAMDEAHRRSGTLRPWSPVNNCTQSPISGTGRRRVRKRGFHTNWREKRGKGEDAAT